MWDFSTDINIIIGIFQTVLLVYLRRLIAYWLYRTLDWKIKERLYCGYLPSVIFPLSGMMALTKYVWNYKYSDIFPIKYRDLEILVPGLKEIVHNCKYPSRSIQLVPTRNYSLRLVTCKSSLLLWWTCLSILEQLALKLRPKQIWVIAKEVTYRIFPQQIHFRKSFCLLVEIIQLQYIDNSKVIYLFTIYR
jgi:hypothetical protein